jgi:hypothetical protein
MKKIMSLAVLGAIGLFAAHATPTEAASGYRGNIQWHDTGYYCWATFCNPASQLCCYVDIIRE